MKHTIITAICAAFVAAVVVFTGLTLVGNQSVGETVQQFGAALGITRYPNSGLAARYLKITTTAGTATAGTDGSFSIGGGTEITGYKCVTATWNPGSLASSSIDGISATSTDIALTGAVAGDLCDASLTSATSSSALVNCTISGTATGTIQLLNIGSAALDLATGTAKVCYTH